MSSEQGEETYTQDSRQWRYSSLHIRVYSTVHENIDPDTTRVYPKVSGLSR